VWENNLTFFNHSFDKFMDICKTYLLNVFVLIEKIEFYHLNSYLFIWKIESKILKWMQVTKKIFSIDIYHIHTRSQKSQIKDLDIYRPIARKLEQRAWADVTDSINDRIRPCLFDLGVAKTGKEKGLFTNINNYSI
jgi:hypothetical protein